jgi:hypothetical protein
MSHRGGAKNGTATVQGASVSESNFLSISIFRPMHFPSSEMFHQVRLLRALETSLNLCLLSALETNLRFSMSLTSDRPPHLKKLPRSRRINGSTSRLACISLAPPRKQLDEFWLDKKTNPRLEYFSESINF